MQSQPVARSPRTRDVIRVTIVVAVTLGGLVVLFLLREVVLIAGLAFFFAVALEPAIRLVQRVVRSRALGVVILLLLLLVAVSGFVASVASPIAEQVSHLVENIPRWSREVQDADTPLGRLFQRYDIEQRVQSAVGRDPSRLLGNVRGAFGAVFGAVANVLVFLVLMLYFLTNMPRMKRELLRLVPRERRARAAALTENVFSKVGGWMEGMALVSITAGAVAFVFLLLMRVPYPHALAMFVSLCALIPMVGALLGAIVCTIVAFAAGGTVDGVVTFVFFILYQQVENYVVSPRIMKKTVDVSPATVILAAMAGATLLGPVGILVAVPAAAALKVVVRELIGQRDAQGDPTPPPEPAGTPAPEPAG